MNECLKYNIFQQHCPARLFFEKLQTMGFTHLKYS